MEREPQGGSDFGLDLARDAGEDSRRAPRRRAGPAGPDRRVRAGQRPRRRPAVERLDRRDAGARLVGRRADHLPGPPAGRDAGPAVTDVSARGARRRRETASTRSRSSTRARAGLPVVYALTPAASTSSSTPTTSFVGRDRRAAPGRRARATSPRGRRGAAWTDEVSGERRLLSSDTGEGWDASRILLPEVIDHLAARARLRRAGPRRDPGAAPARRRLAPAQRRRLRGAVRRVRRRAVGRRRRADRPARVRAVGRAARRVRGDADTRLTLVADLRVETADAVATVTLDRPDALNALTIPLKEALIAAFAGFAADPAVRAIVLTGAGRAFCAGQDLKERLEPGAPPLDVELRDRYNPLVRAMRSAAQPMVARHQRRRRRSRRVDRLRLRPPDRRRGRHGSCSRSPARPDPRQRRDVDAPAARRRVEGRRDRAV